MADSLHYKLSEHDFELLGSGRLALSDPKMEIALADFHSVFFRRIVGNSRTEFHRAFERAAAGDNPPDWDELEEVTKAEFGQPISKLLEILMTVAYSPFTTTAGIGSCQTEELLRYLNAMVGLEQSEVESALKLYSLTARSDFVSPPKPFCLTDVYPWRFNRALSYLRWPLVVSEMLGATTYLWGRRALSQTASYLLRLCVSGQLKNAQSTQMIGYPGRIANRIGRAFNERVAAELRKVRRLVVRQQVKKLVGQRIKRANGDDLGDIDVLVADPDSTAIFAIEAKCLSLAKTPVELANERQELFGDLKGRAGAVGRHLERCRWLSEHLSLVLKELRIESDCDSQWNVVPLMVLDTDLVTPRLEDLPFQVVTLDVLLETLPLR